jgi:uncharacterized protein YdiU (UPF0061 family)
MPLSFDNSFAREMPLDPIRDLRARKVRGAMYSLANPTPVANPRMLAWSSEVAELLGIGSDPLSEEESARWARVLSGNEMLEGMQPIATRYGGHQFGNWAGQLGDGRAISLGEVRTKEGRLELQLKGAGKTPYSRGADGRAVLRSSLREFICSEAMHHLGIPTTRALSLVLTGDEVERDMFYDGRPADEPGAVVCRVAPSFLRFGHMEILASDDEVDLLAKLFGYLITTHYPGFSADAEDPEAVLAFFEEICTRTMTMVVGWQRVGFVHGVMNTDNLSLLGLTIDYGPYGFIEPYDPMWTPNTTDAQGRRYRFGNQPNIALWNLARLAESLAPLLLKKLEGPEVQSRLIAILEKQQAKLGGALAAMFASKLGITAAGEEDATVRLALSTLAATSADYTLFFRRLARVVLEASNERAVSLLEGSFYGEVNHGEKLLALVEAMRARWATSGRSPEEIETSIKAHAPIVVPRNWLAQEAIEAATAGDLAPLHRLIAVLKTPYEEREENAHFALKRPAWAEQKPGCSALSCSS